MSFITIANVQTIIFNSDLENIDLKSRIYDIPIHFFSKYEKNALSAFQELLKDPEKYFTEIYRPKITEDTLTYVYEGKKPSYHEYCCCPRLCSDYQNFEIPPDIKRKGPNEVKKFRKWFETQKHHLIKKPDLFVFNLELDWKIRTNPRAINRDNSGYVKFENMKIEDLKERIDRKIKAAGWFYYKNEKNTAILKKFSKIAHLWKKEDAIYGNDTGYSDEDVKEFLKYYDKQFKMPLKADLIEYYRLKLNPEIKMKGLILKRLGFKACAHCHRTNYEKKEVTTHYGNDKNYIDQEVKDLLKDYGQQLLVENELPY